MGSAPNFAAYSGLSGTRSRVLESRISSGVTVMWSVLLSNWPFSTMTMVPSWPRIKPGMWCELAMEELSTSEWPAA